MNVTRLGFTGTYLDLVTPGYPLGNGYRWYLPSLMRFSAPDDWSPFGAGGINPYSYCAADPINATDPTGHVIFEESVMDIEKIESNKVINFIPASAAPEHWNPQHVLSADDVDNEFSRIEKTKQSGSRKRTAEASSHDTGTSGSIAARQAAEAAPSRLEGSPAAKRPKVDSSAGAERRIVTGISLAYDFSDELKNAKANPLELPAPKKSDRALTALHRFASEAQSSKRFPPPEHLRSIAFWADFPDIAKLRVRLNQEIQWATDATRLSALQMIKSVIGLES